MVGFRYRLPRAPVASTSVDIGQVEVRIVLSLDGEVAVAGPDRAPCLAAVRELGTGVRVGGVSGPRPRITAGAGHRFTQTTRSFRVPDTAVSAGLCVVDFARAAVSVAGTLRYRLAVSARPRTDGGRPAWDGARAWMQRHDQEVSAIGMVVLAAVPVAPDRLVAS
ncbi:hypothetical protein [Actinokineospora sp. UTMC 2448]|uniref:hypothetical protein n=1 Tax=Actinokineospora sp. UTMC 2448 TaxID=2268449 RepID=UPI002164B80D|nr:hypothetical protein [Actinokineospora sp. UTMC 2448]UVS80850.1 hypothetical protein Actkin_04602 [Actinokineospora sp. UTMC 2448]